MPKKGCLWKNLDIDRKIQRYRFSSAASGMLKGCVCLRVGMWVQT